MSDRTYKALLIGNSTFPNDSQNLQSLEGPVNDIAVLRDALTHPVTGLFESTAVRLLPERTMSEILIELETFFASASREDRLLLYYSGHGLLTDENRLLLCARDTRTDVVKATSVSATAINDMIDSSAAQTTIIVLDCCYSGAFKGANLPDSLKGNGRFLLTSTRSTQLANDATRRNGTSLFTQHLVDGLLNAVPDTNGDGYVELGEIYDYVHSRLVAEGRQIPQRSFSGGGGVAVARRPRELAVDESRPPSGFELSQTTLELDDVEADETLPPEHVYVLTAPGETVGFSVSTEADWLTVEPHEGYFSVALNPRPGTNRANIVVRDRETGATKTLRVKVRAADELASPPPAPAGGGGSGTAVPAPPEPDPAAKRDREHPAGAESSAARRGPLARLTGRNRTLAFTAAAVVVILGVVGIVMATRPSGTSSSSTPVSGPGPATLYKPGDVAVDASGAVYVNDSGHSRVRRIGPDGQVTTIVGRGGDDPPAPAGSGGSATSESVTATALTTDSAGNLVVAVAIDSGGGIAKIAPDGSITTVPIVIPGGTVPKARAMAVSPEGRLVLVVGDALFKLQPGGNVEVVAGSGVEGYTGDGGPATAARFYDPTGIAIDSQGAIYIADTNNHRVRLVRPDGTIVTVTGDGTAGKTGRGGPATAAAVNTPYGLALDDRGDLYIASTNQLLRVGKDDGIITVVAGSPDDELGFSGDDGPATAALFNGIEDVAVDSAGNIYVSDSGNNRVRRISPEGTVTTVG